MFLKVRMTVVDGLDFIEFIVKDRGETLTREELTNVFKPPIQRQRGVVGGMGLGLVYLAERVKTLGGQYGAREREDGKNGTKLSFLQLLIFIRS